MDKEAQLAEYFRENGFVHLSQVIEPVMCQKLIFRMKDLVAKINPLSDQVFDAEHQKTKVQFLIDSAHRILCFFDKNAPNTTDPFRALNKVGHGLHKKCPVYQKFSETPYFFDLMKCLGQKKPEIIQSMFIFKQPLFGDIVPAHQDASFIYTEPSSVIGLWIALQDATVENGCLWVLPKAHTQNLKERFVYKNGCLNFEYKKPVHWPKKDFIPLNAKVGDIIILHGKLPHFSEKNYSLKTRYAFTLHFIDRANYFPKENWLNQ